jgi:hypothetical protein
MFAWINACLWPDVDVDASEGCEESRTITLFGYHLFGRPPPPPPIHLPEHSTDALYASTFDSDAAPLGTDTIAALSSSPSKGKERRLGDLDGDVFEGFQGSGHGFAPDPLPRPPPRAYAAHEDEEDTADLDGAHYYARNTSAGSNTGSDSRSASQSISDRQHKSTTKKPKSKSKKTSSSRTTRSSSSHTPSSRHIVSPTTVEQGQGFFDLEEHDTAPDPGYLPITGFGGSLSTSRKASYSGAILAQRGN